MFRQSPIFICDHRRSFIYLIRGWNCAFMWWPCWGWQHCCSWVSKENLPKTIIIEIARRPLLFVVACLVRCVLLHYDDVIMTTIASQITSLTSVYSTVYSDAHQRKHQSSASLAFVWGIHRDRWIPRTKGQLRGKCFHLMTSSCLLTHYGLVTPCSVGDLGQHWFR